jgi:hypothetical protein
MTPPQLRVIPNQGNLRGLVTRAISALEIVAIDHLLPPGTSGK